MSCFAVIPTVADIAQTTIEPSTVTVFVLGYHTPNVGPFRIKRAVAEPVHLWKFQSADGSWWEGFSENDEDIYIRAFGARLDGSDDYHAFQSAFSYIAATKVSGTHYPGVFCGYRLHLAHGDCRISDTLMLPCGLEIVGHGAGMSGCGSGSRLLIPYNRHGIVVQPNAGGSKLTGFSLLAYGPKADYVDAPYDGIKLFARAKITDITVRGFQRDGINITASATSTDPDATGNANNWFAGVLSLTGNKRRGLHIDGADVNAGVAIAVDASTNGEWGIYDSAFLGNTHIGHHTAGNASGAYFSDNPNSGTAWIGCYAEKPQTCCIKGRNLVVAGQNIMNAGACGMISSNFGDVAGSAYVTETAVTDTPYSVQAKFGGAKSIGAGFEGHVWSTRNSNWGTGLVSLYALKDKATIRLSNLLSYTYLNFLIPSLNGGKFGLHVPHLFVGDTSVMRKITVGGGPPTSGTWVKGDKIFNANAETGAPESWTCIASGEPGTWAAGSVL